MPSQCITNNRRRAPSLDKMYFVFQAVVYHIACIFSVLSDPRHEASCRPQTALSVGIHKSYGRENVVPRERAV